LRLRSREAAQLERLARLFRRSVGATASLLLEEKLRNEEFPYIEFRNSQLGRQAFVRGRRLSVWEVSWLAERLGNDPSRVAEYLNWPVDWIEAALAYARTYSDEIEPLVKDARSVTFDTIRSKVPGIQAVEL
jgi:uncharacterized protein (DUF433 family)